MTPLKDPVLPALKEIRACIEAEMLTGVRGHASNCGAPAKTRTC